MAGRTGPLSPEMATWQDSGCIHLQQPFDVCCKGWQGDALRAKRRQFHPAGERRTWNGAVYQQEEELCFVLGGGGKDEVSSQECSQRQRECNCVVAQLVYR